MLPVFRPLFVIYQISACWFPNNFSRRWKYPYYTWTIFYLISIMTLLIFQLLDLVLVRQSLASIISNCPLIFAHVNGCIKSLNIVWKKKEIEDLMMMFRSDMCEPRDKIEKKVKERANQTCRFLNKFCTILTALIVIGLFVDCLIRKQYHIHTRFFSTPLEKSSWFWPLFVWGAVVSAPMAGAIVASNCLLAGVMIQMCAQLDILKYRFSVKLQPKWSCFIRQYQRNHIHNCLQHHLFIFQMAERIQTIFNPALYAQTAITAGNFATSVFQLMLIDVKSLRFITVIFYILHSIEEGWIFFWYGNQVIEKYLLELTHSMCEISHCSCKFSFMIFLNFTRLLTTFKTSSSIHITFPMTSIVNEYSKDNANFTGFSFAYKQTSLDIRNGVYSMNWIDAQQYLRLEVLNIMQRTSRPIVFTSIFRMAVSTDAFSRILYSSYQAFALFRKIT